MKVAVLDDYQDVALSMADWSALPEGWEPVVFRDHLADEGALVERLRGFDAVIGMRERTAFPRSVLNGLPDLRLLITTGGRNASFDVEAATELGIVVCGTGGAGEGPTELTWGLIIGLLRKIPQEDRLTREGRWQTTIGVGLKDKTLGLIGLGHIGGLMARVGNAFQMNVIAWSQNLTAERAAECQATLVDKDTLFRESDIASVHLRLSDRTRGLVGAREIALMKPTAYLVNISRGPIVDEGGFGSCTGAPGYRGGGPGHLRRGTPARGPSLPEAGQHDHRPPPGIRDRGGLSRFLRRGNRGRSRLRRRRSGAGNQPGGVVGAPTAAPGMTLLKHG